MRPVHALYKNGMLQPAKPLPLQAGERVVLMIQRLDPSRWDLARLGASPQEDESLAQAGLDDWATALEDEDRG